MKVYDYAYIYHQRDRNLDMQDTFVEINKMGADGWRLSHVFGDEDDDLVFVMERVQTVTSRQQKEG